MSTSAPSAEEHPCEKCQSIGANDALPNLSVIQIAAVLENQIQLALSHSTDLHAIEMTLSQEVAALRAVVAQRDLQVERDRMLCEDFRSQMLRSSERVESVQRDNDVQASYIADLEDAVLQQETRIRIMSARNEQLRIQRIDTRIDRDPLMNLLTRHSAHYRMTQQDTTVRVPASHAQLPTAESPCDVLQAMRVTLDVVSAAMEARVAQPPAVLSRISQPESTKKSNAKKISKSHASSSSSQSYQDDVTESSESSSTTKKQTKSRKSRLLIKSTVAKTTDTKTPMIPTKGKKRRSSVIEIASTKRQQTTSRRAKEPASRRAEEPASRRAEELGFGQHTEESFHLLVAALLREFNHSRYWGSIAFTYEVTAGAASTANHMPSTVELRNPMNAMQPHRLHIFPLANEVSYEKRTAQDHSYEALRRLITEVEEAEPWQTIIGLWPEPVTFDNGDERYQPLHNAMKAWVLQHGARLLFYRTHNFKYSAYIPVTPPKSSSERALIEQALAIDKRNDKNWSKRCVNSQELRHEILRCLAIGLVDVRIFLEPALLLLPQDVYGWSPDLGSGADSLATQMLNLHTAEPWRVLYVYDMSSHPLYRYGYRERIGGIFPDFMLTTTPSSRIPLHTPTGELELREVITNLVHGRRGRRRRAILSLLNVDKAKT